MTTPAAYANTYRNLMVCFTDQPVTVTIERYHIGTPHPEMGILVQAVKEYFQAQLKKDPTFMLDLVVNGQAARFASYHDIKLHIVGPFYGKGSPESCQITAQLAVLTKRTHKDQVARYCDTHLGLDCNGFVGNYLFHEHYGNDWQSFAIESELGPSSLMGKFVAAGMPVTDLTKLNPANLHLFVEVNEHFQVIQGGSGGAGHIVISEPDKFAKNSFVSNSFGGLDLGFAKKGAYGHPALWGVESTGPQGAVGLKESWYAIKSPVMAHGRAVNRGIYEVFRGSKQSNLKFELIAIPPRKT